MNYLNIVMKKKYFYCFILLLLFGCTKSEKSKLADIKKQNEISEYITRSYNSYFFPITTPISRVRDLYPWEEGGNENIQRISKEFFRCRGSLLNVPININADESRPIIYEDCGGSQAHSLPLIHGTENVYPILTELLNYIQVNTKKKVIITCGHRCPLHNKYSDISKNNRTSKHMIGAEVDFYVQGLEDYPSDIIELIFQFYKERKGYAGNREYEIFNRYEKDSTDVSTMPWFNKEIFVKLYDRYEGRDFDNRHPYPYISIQVRYDRDTKERVVYSWDKATSGYLRW